MSRTEKAAFAKDSSKTPPDAGHSGSDNGIRSGTSVAASYVSSKKEQLTFAGVYGDVTDPNAAVAALTMSARLDTFIR